MIKRFRFTMKHFVLSILIQISGQILFQILPVKISFFILLFQIYFQHVDVHRKKANYNEARELYLQSLKQSESLYGQNHPTIADIMNNLAMLLKKEGKYNEALDYLKQALKISKHYYGEQHPSIGLYLTNVGDIYRKVEYIF
jgi:tetratricopeptide (TPR) repeat protein